MIKLNLRGIVFAAIFMVSSIYAGETGQGVAGVAVTLKQNPQKRAVTDPKGNFVLDGLPAGSQTLTFRAASAKDTRTVSTTKVTVATSYSIKVDGAKNSVNQSGVTSDKLLGGVNVVVDVGPGSRIHGQVLAKEAKKMVWIPGEVGSNIPGHWVDADSPEGKRASRNSSFSTSRDTLDRMQNEHTPFHQEGFGGPSTVPGR